MSYQVTKFSPNYERGYVKFSCKEIERPIFANARQIPQGMNIGWLVEFTVFEKHGRWDKTRPASYWVHPDVPIEIIARTKASVALEAEQKQHNEGNTLEMKVSDVYQSDSPFMKGDDLQNQPRQAVIAAVGMHQFENEDKGGITETNLTLSFTSEAGAPYPKPMRLSAAKAHRMVEMFGDDTDQWVGKTITIFPEYYNFKGRTGQTVQIAVATPTHQTAIPNTPQPAAPAPTPVPVAAVPAPQQPSSPPSPAAVPGVPTVHEGLDNLDGDIPF